MKAAVMQEQGLGLKKALIIAGGNQMAEDRKVYSIKEDNLGEVNIADEVVTIIAGLAATEIDGVSSMAGNITNELV